MPDRTTDKTFDMVDPATGEKFGTVTLRIEFGTHRERPSAPLVIEINAIRFAQTGCMIDAALAWIRSEAGIEALSQVGNA